MKHREDTCPSATLAHRKNRQLNTFHYLKIGCVLSGTVLIALALLNLALRIFNNSEFTVIRPNVGEESAEYLLSALLQAEATILALIVTVGLGQTIFDAKGRRLWANISDRQDRYTGTFVMFVLISGICADAIGLLDVAADCFYETCNRRFETQLGHAVLLGVGALFAIVALIFSQIEAASPYLRARLTNRLLKRVGEGESSLVQRDAAELATTLVDEALSRNDSASASALLLVILDGINEAAAVTDVVMAGIKRIARNHSLRVRREVFATISHSDLTVILKRKIGFALRVVPITARRTGGQT